MNIFGRKYLRTEKKCTIERCKFVNLHEKDTFFIDPLFPSQTGIFMRSKENYRDTAETDNTISVLFRKFWNVFQF